MKQILLLVGAKLEHIIVRLAQESVQKMEEENSTAEVASRVRPSNDYFWFGRPRLVLDLLHFTLFQNSFEIAFFFWIWVSDNTINFLQLKAIYFSSVFFFV